MLTDRQLPKVARLLHVVAALVVSALAGFPSQSAADNTFEGWSNSFDHGIELRVGCRSE